MELSLNGILSAELATMRQVLAQHLRNSSGLFWEQETVQRDLWLEKVIRNSNKILAPVAEKSHKNQAR